MKYINGQLASHVRQRGQLLVWLCWIAEPGRRADQPITPDLGIITLMKQTVLIDIMGDPIQVEDKAEIKPYPGLNLIGAG